MSIIGLGFAVRRRVDRGEKLAGRDGVPLMLRSYARDEISLQGFEDRAIA
jgi:hypothetical protein